MIDKTGFELLGRDFVRKDGIARVTGAEHADELACGGAQAVGARTLCAFSRHSRGASRD